MDKKNEMNFIDIPSNKTVKSQLINSVVSSRLSHALLFNGEDGSAILPMAWSFAKYITCQNKSIKDSCGKCSSCVKNQKLIHPDVHWVFPVVTGQGSKPISDHFMSNWRELILEKPYLSLEQWLQAIDAGNKQASIGVQEASELSKKMLLKPFEGSHRVIIIWHAEKMHTATANKLLKLIEEPPNGTVFLLVTDKKEQILPTILSRLQKADVKRLSDQEMGIFLEDKVDDQNQLKQIVGLANGNIGQALTQLYYAEFYEQNITLFQSWMRLCYTAKIIELSEMTDLFSRLGVEGQKSFLNYSLNLIRQCLIHNFSPLSMLKLRGEECTFVEKFSAFIHKDNVADITYELEKAILHIERNGNSKIVFMDLSLRITILLRVKELNLYKTN